MDRADDQVITNAVQGERIEEIRSDVKEIKADVKTVLPIVAAHAEAIGDLKRRVGHVESQLNWGKWAAGIAASVGALATWLQGRV